MIGTDFCADAVVTVDVEPLVGLVSVTGVLLLALALVVLVDETLLFEPLVFLMLSSAKSRPNGLGLFLRFCEPGRGDVRLQCSLLSGSAILFIFTCQMQVKLSCERNVYFRINFDITWL